MKKHFRYVLLLTTLFGLCGCSRSTKAIEIKSANTSAIMFRLDSLAMAASNHYPISIIEWEATNTIGMLELPSFFSPREKSYFTAEAYLYVYEAMGQNHLIDLEMYYSNKFSAAVGQMGIHNFGLARRAILRRDRRTHGVEADGNR